MPTEHQPGRAEWEREPNTFNDHDPSGWRYRVSVTSRDPSLIVSDVRVSGVESGHVHVDARSARPALDWGPFSVGTVFALGCYAIFGVGVYATVIWSLWWLVLVVPFVLLGTMCAVSAINVLIEPRRAASRAERDAYRAQHGSLD